MRQHQINLIRATLLIMQYLRLLWVGAILIASIALVVSLLLAAWCFPVSYLIEGRRYHEQYLVKHLRHAGFEDVVIDYVDIPDSPIRDFKCECRAWVTIDDGNTYHAIALVYDFDRCGWLEGKARFFPTERILKNGDIATVDRYLEWFGHSRDILLRHYEPEPEGTPKATDEAEPQSSDAA